MTARHLEGMLLISLPIRALLKLIFFLVLFPHTFLIGETSEKISDIEPGSQVFYQSYGIQVWIFLHSGWNMFPQRRIHDTCTIHQFDEWNGLVDLCSTFWRIFRKIYQIQVEL